jgi:DNA-binding sugar fermentation-stimulating protein
MITPQEKAIEIIKKFIPHAQYWDCYNDELLKKNHAKQCALIAVEEIIQATKKYVAVVETVPYSKTGVDFVVNTEYDNYWLEVKQEIQKL